MCMFQKHLVLTFKHRLYQRAILAKANNSIVLIQKL